MQLESDKKEVMLSINSFNSPAEVSNKEAWIKLILHLLFLKKGSYPSNPNIGIDIRQYDYQFIDNILTTLPSDIMEQTRLFLPDIPLESVIVETTEVGGKVILLIILTFVDDNVVIATSVANNIIDFEISM